ncbi:MAG: RnfABCDGE type electron transport complex subunit B [Pseudomonadota bacterium]
MSTHARQAASADRIDAWLPQTQCTQCGYPRCRDYAEAVVTGSAGINQCPPGGEVTIAALAKLLNVPSEPLNTRFGIHKPRARAVIDEAVCIGCRKCLDVCPVDAILGARKLMHTVIADECTGCELCLPPCPVDCIAMQAVDAASDSQPWPEYTRAEADRWRVRTGNRLRRRARRKRARHGTPHSTESAAPLPPDRERIRAEIRAAVERVKTKRKFRQD